MKKQLWKIITIMIIVILNLNYSHANIYDNDPNKKILSTMLNNIMDNYEDRYWKNDSYVRLNDFYYEVKEIPQRYTINLLSNVIKDKLHQLEKDYFINKDTIYVNDISEPIFYFDWIETKIYSFGQNKSNYPELSFNNYNICELDNKDFCVKYNDAIFQQSVSNKQINIENKKSIFESNDKILINKLNVYYPSTLDFFNNKKSINTYLTSINHDNINRYYWNKYKNIDKYWKYVDVEGNEYIGEYNIKEVSNIDLASLWNIDKETIFNSMKRDMRYLDYIDKNIILDLNNEIKNIPNDISSIYKYVKNELEYDYDVYDEFLRSGNVADNKNYVFSWLWSYNNKKSVCSGYSGLFEFILWLKWYNNVEPIDWDYIDTQTGELIPHTWLRVNNKYYDVTFDDWLNSDNTTVDLYFWLPKEIINIDRIPNDDRARLQAVEKMTNQERIEYVKSEYLKMSIENNKLNYDILKPYNILINNFWVRKINDLNLNYIFNNADDKFLFNINNWNIDFNVTHNNKEKAIREISLLQVKNIEILIQMLSFNKDIDLNNIKVWKDQNNNYYIIEKIVFN